MTGLRGVVYHKKWGGEPETFSQRRINLEVILHPEAEVNFYVETLEKPWDHQGLTQAELAYLAVGGEGLRALYHTCANWILNLGGVALAEVVLERGLAAAA